MNIDEKPYEQNEPAKCTTCKNFYASQAYNGLCSSCFKKTESKKNQVELDNLRKQSIDTQADLVPNEQQKVQEIKKTEQPQKQVDRKRCYNCKKKVGLLGLECKCGFVFCNTHRLPEEHSCSFNHREVAKDRLKQTLVKVYNGKIAEI